MEKLIFYQFYLNTTKFFLSTLIMIGIIVWTIQAVNFFDIVIIDGHGLKVYFLYALLNFPKIINRLLPFIFFISLFYVLLSYEKRNELNIFWINGVDKIKFLNKIIKLSIVITMIQIMLGTYFSPVSQFKARGILKNSDIGLFSSLVNPGKFINIAKNMTIFIEMKNEDQSYKNIFIEDNRNSSKMIYAKKGVLLLDETNKKFQLFNGRIIDNNNSKINIFNFDKIDLDLSNIKSKTITSPKIQELNTFLLFKCLFNTKFESVFFRCNKEIFSEIKEELFKRILKPFYIPLLALIAGCLILFSKQKKNYNSLKKLLFIFAFLIIIFSEGSVKYVGSINNFYFFSFLSSIPLIIFIIVYVTFYKRSFNV